MPTVNRSTLGQSQQMNSTLTTDEWSLPSFVPNGVKPFHRVRGNDVVTERSLFGDGRRDLHNLPVKVEVGPFQSRCFLRSYPTEPDKDEDDQAVVPTLPMTLTEEFPEVVGTHHRGFHERDGRAVDLLHGVRREVVPFDRVVQEDTEVREEVFLGDVGKVPVSVIDIVGDFPSGDFTDFAVPSRQVEELGEGLPHIPFVVPGPTDLEFLPKELLQHLPHHLLTIGGVLVGQVERHHIGEVGADGSEPFQRVEDLSLSFPQLTDGDGGRVVLAQVALGVGQVGEELATPVSGPVDPEIDRVAVNGSVATLD